MRNILALWTTFVLAASGPTFAQNAGSEAGERGAVAPTQIPELKILTDEETGELLVWIDEGREFLKWKLRWFNRYQRNIYGILVKHRKQEPSSPSWLPAECQLRSHYDNPPEGLVYDSCLLLDQLRADLTEDPAVTLARQVVAKIERPAHTSFKERIYLDGMWSIVNTETSAVGWVGVHTTWVGVKRLNLFVLPGFMLVSVLDETGGRGIRPAATWGATVRLFDFNLPGASRRSVAHLTMAKVYVFGTTQFGRQQNLDMAGLSISWKTGP